MKYYIYVLRSNIKDKYYVGSTGNLEDRLNRHNSGKSKYTKGGIPWKLVYIEEYNTRSEAVQREKQLKSWKSRVRLEKLITDAKGDLK